MFLVDKLILLGAVLLLMGIVSSKFSTRLGLPVLVLFLAVGMLAGEDGIGRIEFDNFVVAHAIGTIALGIILFDGRASNAPACAAPRVEAVGAARDGRRVRDRHGHRRRGVAHPRDPADGRAAARQHRGLDGRRRGVCGTQVPGAPPPPADRGDTRDRERVERPDGHLPDGGVPGGPHRPDGVGDRAGAALRVADGSRRAGRPRVRLGGRSAHQPDRPRGSRPVPGAGRGTCGLLAYGVAASLGGSGFLSIYLAGIVLGNSRMVFERGTFLFMDGLAWIGQITMFVVLGLLSTPSELVGVAGPGLLGGGGAHLRRAPARCRPAAAAVPLLAPGALPDLVGRPQGIGPRRPRDVPADGRASRGQAHLQRRLLRRPGVGDLAGVDVCRPSRHGWGWRRAMCRRRRCRSS